MTRSLVLTAAFLIAAIPARAQAQASAPAASDSPLAATLALPISPGSIALLVGHGDDLAAQQRVREALRDARPAVRAVAARVAYGAGLQMLLADLRAALKAEQDPVAAAEEVRTLMTFAPPLAPECVAAAGRLGAPVANVVVDTYARLNSAELIPQLATLGAAHASPGNVRSALEVLIGGNPTLRDRLLREQPADPMAIEVGLVSFRKTRVQPADDVLLSLLNSDQEPVRQIVAWQVARGVASQTLTLTPALATAVDARITASASAVTWEALGLDLIGRASNRSRHERRWTGLPQGKNPWIFTEDRVLFSPLLSVQESRDLTDVLHISPDALTTRVNDRERLIYQTPRQQEFVARTVPHFVEGFETELLRLTGCDTKELPMVVANVAYRTEGRPRQISIVPDARVTEPCKRAAIVLFNLTIPKLAMPLPLTYSEGLILPMQPEQIACVDAPIPSVSGAPVEGIRLTRDVKPPTRIKMVHPTYPQSALTAQHEGVAIIEATISATGCVMDASVLAGPDPLLSSAALYAVMQWGYTPTMVNGNPVPLIMTVTVSFTLHP